MSTLESLVTAAFTAGRQGLTALKAPGGSLLSFADVPELRFATGVGVSARSEHGRPKSAACSWSEFCEGVTRYAEVVIGPAESDKRFASAYVLAGELTRRSATKALTTGPMVSATTAEQGRPGSAARNDAALQTLTMLILDCDAPASHRRLCRALGDLSLAYCVAPTWSATPDCPKWRLFIPIAPLQVDNTARGRALARLRYAWLCGLLAELGEMPELCPLCSAGAAVGLPPYSGKHSACPACGDTKTFRFDPSCWNYSRLHFLGGRKTADQDMATRAVSWGKGLALDIESWLAGSGWGAFWAQAWEVLERETYALVGTPTSDEPSDGSEDNHPDPLLADAIGRCKIGLLERVRRAAIYIGSPNFPAAIAGQGGETAVMRACNVVVSGFLVPLGDAVAGSDVAWAQRILDTVYKPRCNPKWSDKYIARKLRQVRAVAGQVCGGLLAGSGLAGREQRFYVVNGACFGERGEQWPALGRELVALLMDAARSCALRPYDPMCVPVGFVPRLQPSGPQRTGKTRMRNGTQ